MIYIYDNNLNKKCVLPYTFEFLQDKNLTLEEIYKGYNSSWFATEKELKYPKIENGVLVEKTTEDLKLEGIIELEDGEYIENDKILYKKYTDNFIKPFWNVNTKTWIEGATKKEQEDFYFSEMFNLQKDLDTLKNLGFEGRSEYVEKNKKLEEIKLKYSSLFQEEAIVIDKIISSNKTK